MKKEKCKKNLIILVNGAEDVLVWDIFTTFATMAVKRHKNQYNTTIFS
jgi:hypothetical protein